MGQHIGGRRISAVKPDRELKLRASVCFGVFFVLLVVQLALLIVVLCWGVTGTAWKNLVSLPIMFCQSALMLSSGWWLAPLLAAIIMPENPTAVDNVEGELRG